MVCEGTLRVAAVVVLVQLGAAQEEFATVDCTDGVCNTGVSQNLNTNANGVTTGECVYKNALGEPIKITFRETPDGRVNAVASHTSVRDAVAELGICRKALETVSQHVNQNIQQTQDEIRLEHQKLNEEILREQQAFFNEEGLPFPPLGFQNRFPFNINNFP